MNPLLEKKLPESVCDTFLHLCTPGEFIYFEMERKSRNLASVEELPGIKEQPKWKAAESLFAEYLLAKHAVMSCIGTPAYKDVAKVIDELHSSLETASIEDLAVAIGKIYDIASKNKEGTAQNKTHMVVQLSPSDFAELAASLQRVTNAREAEKKEKKKEEN